MATWNPAVSGPAIDPHSVPYTEGSIEPTPEGYHGVYPSSTVTTSPSPDPHNCPLQLSDGLGGGMETGETPSNIHGGPLDAGRTLNVSGDR